MLQYFVISKLKIRASRLSKRADIIIYGFIVFRHENGYSEYILKIIGLISNNNTVPFLETEYQGRE